MNTLALSSNRRLLALVVCILSIAIVCGLFNARSRAAGTGSLQNQPAAMLPGDVDLTFNPTIERPGAGVFDLILQPDGKSLIGGAFTTVNGVGRNRVARLNSDGSVDTTFNPGVGPDSSVFDLSLQTDGKVLLAGPFTSVGGVARNGLARLNSDGSLDTNFVPVLTNWESINVVCAQANGQVLFGGRFVSGFSVIRFRRLNNDGSVDSTFTPTFSGVLDQNKAINIIVEQADGKILVGGDFSGLENTARTDILRVNSDGSLDTTFNPNTGAGSTDVLGIAVQTNGKIMVGGDFTTMNGTARDGVARLNGDGTLDTGFDPGTGLAGGAALSFGIQTDGKVLLAGQFTTVNGSGRSGVARVNSNGSLDSTFNPGTGTNSTVFALALQADGKVWLGGTFSKVNGVSLANLARLSSDGSVDGAFNGGSGANIGGSVTSMALQIDGKILISDSAFTAVNGVARSRFARLNSDGSLDTAFTVTADSSASAFALQPDGKILIGGFFTTINGVGRASVARLNSDGSLDTGFNPGTGATGGGVSALALQTDGKIVIGGSFISVDGTARNKIARLNSNGSLDTAFTASVTGTNAQVSSLALQPDGKILVGGFFSAVNSVSRANCARLNSDGTLETIFNPATSLNGGVNAIAIQPDGKVVIGGSFFISNGQGRDRIARLNNDGSFDSAFNSGTNPNGVNALSLQLDGKILVGGDYTLINGVTGNRLTRLNADGTTDTTFNIGTGANKVVRALALQLDGKILVGGFFTNINGISRTGIARLIGDGAIATPSPSPSPSPSPACITNPLVLNSNDSGAGSLRQAILDACPGSTIAFSNNSFTITLQSELVIDKSLTIQGGSANLFVTLDGNNASRVLNITNSSATVTLSGLSIRHGKSDQGGGIRSVGTLNLVNTFVGNNSTVTDKVGGSIYVAGGSLNLSAQSGITASTGGGIFLCGTDCGAGNSSSATITNSVISGNSTNGTTSAGGGITLGAQTTVTIVNSTLSGNTSTGDGGAIFNGGGTLTLINSTVSNNTANSGGGISSSGSTSLRNTIVAGNNGPTSPDVAGAYASPQFNLIGKSDGSSGFSNGANGNIVGTVAAPVDPKLGPFTNNGCGGCITATHALLAGSPAINAGNNALAVNANSTPLTTDQRGFGFQRIVNGTVDIGAFEVQGATPTPTPTPTPSAATIQFAQASYNVPEDVTFVTITINRSGDTSGASTVDYATADVTATERKDYTTAVGTLRFAAGEMSKTIDLLISEDSFVEGVETFSIALTNPTGANLGAVSIATVQINDDVTEPATNAIDDAADFVGQHYHDFLNRQADTSGLNFWTGMITSCGSTASCIDQKRSSDSAAFFLSIEFQQTGFQVIRMYKATFTDSAARPRGFPRYREFLRDEQEISRGVIVSQGNWQLQLSDNTLNFARAWVQRPEVLAVLPDTGAIPDQYVDKLFANSEVTPTAAERSAAVTAFGAGGADGRARALLSVTASGSVFNKQYNPAFVLMQYLGYLRRNPDDAPNSDYSGFDFWLNKLNAFSSAGEDVRDSQTAERRVLRAQMVTAFIVSTEYRQRFGP